MKKGFLLGLMVVMLGVSLNGGLFDFLKKSGKGKKAKKIEMKFLVNQPRLLDIYEKYTTMFVEKYNADNDAKIVLEVESFPADQYSNILKSKSTRAATNGIRPLMSATKSSRQIRCLPRLIYLNILSMPRNVNLKKP